MRNSLFEAIHSCELEPTFLQEQQTARDLVAATSGASRRDVRVLRTHFADEIQAARSLPGLTAWAQTGFVGDEPAGLDRLNADLRSHPH